jgi:hypothetical protein
MKHLTLFELAFTRRLICCSRWTVLLLLLLHCTACTVDGAKRPEPEFGVLRVWNANKGQMCHTAELDSLFFLDIATKKMVCRAL